MQRALPGWFLRVWLCVALALGALHAHGQTTSGNSSTGATLWANATGTCSGCHGASPTSVYMATLNGANAGGIIRHAANRGMGAPTTLSDQQYADLAAFIADSLPANNPSNQPIPFNSAGTAFTLPNITIPSPWSELTAIVLVTPPAKGSVVFSGTSATYTPTAGQSGADSFTYVGSGGGRTTSVRTATVIIANPPPPVVTSATSSGWQTGVTTFTYQVIASNSPTSYSAPGLAAIGLAISNSGLISGTPNSTGSFPISVTATNAGGTSAAGTITINVTVGPPVITSSTTAPSGAEGQVYSGYNTTVLASTPATSYSAVGLPPGLTINVSTGVVSGTPTGTTPQTYNATITATNAAGSGNRGVAFPIGPPVPAVTSATSNGWQTGVGTFSYQVIATGSPTSYSAPGLAAIGLAISNTGLITGTPNSVGSFPISVTATNATGSGPAGTITINVVLGPPVITSAATMPDGGEGNVYPGYTVTATNPPHTSYGATGLPAGLTINPSTGAISGTPAAGTGAGSPYSVTVSATNSNSTGSLVVSLNISAAAPVISSAGTASGQTGAAFSYQIVAANAPTAYSAAGLPPGVTVNTTTGLISGTPTSVGTFNAIITASNGSGSDSNPLVITITLGPPVITSGATASGAAGFAFSYQITASNSPISFAATGLPPGVTVNTSSGLVSGTPTANGTYNATVSATNATGTGNLAVTITISFGIPVINSPATASGATGVAFSYQITGTNGPTSYGASPLPGGLVVDAASGVISGVPDAAGGYTVNLTATNATGTGSRALTINIGQSSPVVTSASTASGGVGSPFSYPVVVANGPVSMTTSTLPPGLAFDPVSQVIGGTPTSGGTYAVVISASNTTGTSNFTLTIVIGFQPVTVQDLAVEVAYETTRSFELPISGQFTSVTIVTLPEHGLVTVQGGTATYTPAIGYSGDDSFTFTATNPAGTTAIATVRIAVTTLVPVASAATMTVQVNSPGTADLARFIRASGLTGVSISTQPTYGTVAVNGTVVTYTPRADFFGADSFSYVAFGNAGKSTPAPVSVSVVGRPNPAEARDVAGIVDAQVQAARRFSGAQVGNFQRRMETLHRGRDIAPRSDPVQPEAAPAAPAAHAPAAPTALAPAAGEPRAVPGMVPVSLLAPLLGVTTTRALELNGSTGNGNGAAGFAGGINLWIAGSAQFGRRNAEGELSGMRFSTDGVSLGVDRRLSERLVLGLGVGFGRDETDVGTHGSRSKVRGQSFALYGSFQPSVETFIDVLVGAGRLEFDSTRQVAAVEQFATGSRKGDQAFASLAAGAEFRTEAAMISPYGRIDLASDRLKAYTESGAGAYSLTYHDQRINSSQFAMGVRAESVHDTDFGRVVPRLRLEYRRQLDRRPDASVSYADLFNSGQEYSIGAAGTSRNALLLGVGGDFLFRGGLKIGLDYQAQRASGASNVQGVRLLVSQELDGRGLAPWSWQPKMFKDPIGAEFGYSFDDNVTRGRLGEDKLADRIFSLSVGEPIPLKLGSFEKLRAVVTPSASGEKFQRHAGLGKFSVGVQGEIQYRDSGAFDAMTYTLVGRANYDEYQTRLRTGPRYFVGVNARRSLTDLIDVFAEVGMNARDGRSDVFRTRDYAAKMNLDYSLGRRGILYLSAEYRRGDTVSTGAPSLVNVGLSDVFVEDDAFTVQDFYAYRLDARTVLGTIGWNYPLGPRDSLDFSYRRVQSTPTGRASFDGAGALRYIDNQYSIVYLMRF